MDVRANIPDFNTPILGPDGRVNEIWWRFLLQLFNRTGGEQGSDGGTIEIITLDNAAALDSYTVNPGAAILGQLMLEALQQAQVQLLRQAAQQDVPPVSVLRRLEAQPELVPVMRRSDAVSDVPIALQRQCGCDCADPVASHGLQYDPDLHALATPSAAGFMSAADKAKLDSL